MILTRGRKPSKFNVDLSRVGKLERTYRGHVYRSLLEAHHARELDLLIGAGEIRAWSYERPIAIRVNGVAICTYLADFWVEYVDGRVQIHETKGFQTAVWKLKRLLLEATYLHDHPEVAFILVR
jgi:hypothetical protein